MGPNPRADREQERKETKRNKKKGKAAQSKARQSKRNSASKKKPNNRRRPRPNNHVNSHIAKQPINKKQGPTVRAYTYHSTNQLRNLHAHVRKLLTAHTNKEGTPRE